jgi:hypothetical protein
MPSWKQDVYSSDAQSVGYDPDTQTLTVTFSRGGTYAYTGVPEDVAQEAANAASVGSYLNDNVKGNYPYRRIS